MKSLEKGNSHVFKITLDIREVFWNVTLCLRASSDRRFEGT